MRKVAPDSRADLRDFLCRPQAVEARQQRGVQLAGTAGSGAAATARSAALWLSVSRTALVISSMNSGMPSVRSMMSFRMFAGSGWSPTM
jgi:hypothetical protein